MCLLSRAPAGFPAHRTGLKNSGFSSGSCRMISVQGRYREVSGWAASHIHAHPADLIKFNLAHCQQEMKYFGQEVFDLAEQTTGLGDPVYLDARALCLEKTRSQGIDKVIADQRLDAIVAPIYSFGSSAPAVAGYPNISVPTGVTADGRPGGIWMYGGFLQEPKLLAFAYDLEQEIGGRPKPKFLGSLPPLPPDAGICGSSQQSAIRTQAAVGHGVPRHLGTGKPLVRP